jgi:ABC-type multidrug transport system fused ATPase/permease subunit
LVALKEGLTLIVVAHRLSTLDLCDRIMVIVDGRLEAFDTDENLRKQNAYYHSASLLAAASGSVAL